MRSFDFQVTSNQKVEIPENCKMITEVLALTVYEGLYFSKGIFILKEEIKDRITLYIPLLLF